MYVCEHHSLCNQLLKINFTRNDIILTEQLQEIYEELHPETWLNFSQMSSNYIVEQEDPVQGHLNNKYRLRTCYYWIM